jgi:hypothetical protein
MSQQSIKLTLGELMSDYPRLARATPGRGKYGLNSGCDTVSWPIRSKNKNGAASGTAQETRPKIAVRRVAIFAIGII